MFKLFKLVSLLQWLPLFSMLHILVTSASLFLASGVGVRPPMGADLLLLHVSTPWLRRGVAKQVSTDVRSLVSRQEKLSCLTSPQMMVFSRFNSESIKTISALRPALRVPT